jgi:hypothetical protein
MSGLRLLPYPAGKLFAFTIVDDTDGQTLEMIRPIYDYMADLGLRTTKTIWALPPVTEPTRDCDRGDTLERPEYVSYLLKLRDMGFEIALHNVTSRDTPRSVIGAGFERFREVFGEYPAMNIHHEKNRENIYFDVAQDVNRVPSPYRSTIFRALHERRRRNAPTTKPSPCEGEKENSEYFWGDVCREKLRYVRTNVFINDLNTLKICPDMPLKFSDTPYVNHWFYNSEGQDAAHFNGMLTAGKIRRLQEEKGCSILYTHFGKGFVEETGDGWTLNSRAQAGLRQVAETKDGWFAPATTILDRLMAFQNIEVAFVHGGLAIRNGSSADINSVTFVGRAGQLYHASDGTTYRAGSEGQFVLPQLKRDETIAVSTEQNGTRVQPAVFRNARCWNSPSGSPLVADLRYIAAAVGRKLEARQSKRNP